MLAHQQGGWRHHRHLPTRQRHGAGCPQRHLSLAKADIAANQPIHCLTRRQIGQHIGNRLLLILGLRIGKAGAEGLIGGLVRGNFGRLRHRAAGRRLNQLPRHFQQAFLHPRLTRLPGCPAQAIQGDARGGLLPPETA